MYITKMASSCKLDNWQLAIALLATVHKLTQRS